MRETYVDSMPYPSRTAQNLKTFIFVRCMAVKAI